MKKSKIFALGAALLLAVGGLAGCSSGDKVVEEEPVDVVEETEEPDGDVEVEEEEGDVEVEEDEDEDE